MLKKACMALAAGATVTSATVRSRHGQAAPSAPGGKTQGALQQLSQQLPTDKLQCQNQPGAARPHLQAVLVSCGSFNPPTYMHMRMFEVASQRLQQAGFDVIGSYLSPVNDKYGKPGLAPAPHRAAMCRLAAADSPYIMVDTWEAAQDTAQRSLVVLQRVAGLLQDAFGAEKPLTPSRPADGDQGQPPVRSVLLCGADLLHSFATPGVWLPEQLEEILAHHGVVCVTRPGSDVEELLQRPGTLLHQHRDNILTVSDVITNTISSSAVRQELQQGRSVRYLIPEEVRRYIAAHGLYSDSSLS